MLAVIAKFQKSIYFPLLVGAVVMVCRLFALDLVCFGILALFFCLTLLLNKDTLATLPMLLMGVFAVTQQNMPYLSKEPSLYQKPSTLIYFAVLVILMLGCIVYRLCKNKVRFKCSFMMIPSLIFCLSMCFGGLLFKEYKKESLLMALILSLAYFGIYYFYAITVQYNKDTFARISNIMIVIALVLIAQLVVLYTTFEPFLLNPGKSKLLFGWGISNNIGCYLMLTLIFPLGNMVLKRKIYLNLFLSMLIFASLFFTMSRTSIITAAAMLCIMFIIAFVRMKNRQKLISALITITAVGICVGCIFIFKDRFSFLIKYFVSKKLDDSGRFKLFQFGIDLFKKHPIFGTGIMHLSELESYTKFYHNTLLQMMVSFGVVGLSCYIFYRIMSIIMLIKNRNAENFVYGMAILTILINGLYDIATFAHNIIFVYAVCLAMIEINKRKPKEKEEYLTELKPHENPEFFSDENFDLLAENKENKIFEKQLPQVELDKDLYLQDSFEEGQMVQLNLQHNLTEHGAKNDDTRKVELAIFKSYYRRKAKKAASQIIPLEK